MFSIVTRSLDWQRFNISCLWILLHSTRAWISAIKSNCLLYRPAIQYDSDTVGFLWRGVPMSHEAKEYETDFPYLPSVCLWLLRRQWAGPYQKEVICTCPPLLPYPYNSSCCSIRGLLPLQNSIWRSNVACTRREGKITPRWTDISVGMKSSVHRDFQAQNTGFWAV